MSLCQFGATSSGKRLTGAALALTLWVVIQAISGFAQGTPSPEDPSVGGENAGPREASDGGSLESGSAESGSSQGDAALRFDEGVHAGLREGHVSLTWGPDAWEGEVDEGGEDAERWAKEAGIREYRVTDETGSVYYLGEFRKAFISGLPDGIHKFTVDGLDGEGAAIVSSVEPAVITVNHWPLTYAWGAFFVGLVIFVSLVSVIVAGAVSSRAVTVPGLTTSEGGLTTSEGGFATSDGGFATSDGGGDSSGETGESRPTTEETD